MSERDPKIIKQLQGYATAYHRLEDYFNKGDRKYSNEGIFVNEVFRDLSEYFKGVDRLYREENVNEPK